MQLSPNFTLEQMMFSETALRRGVPNVPGAVEIQNMVRLANKVLEPMLLLIGDFHINSGYRSPVLNQMIGSTEHDSRHIHGEAADTRPSLLALQEAFDEIRASPIPFDKVIIECNAWIHIAVAEVDAKPRRIALIASGSPGNWTYRNA